MRVTVILCALLWSLVDSQTVPPTNVMAVQEGPRGIRVTWTSSSDANGYIISYDNGAGSSDSETVDDGNTDSHTLMDLQNGDTYTVSIVATSETSLPSVSVEADMTISLVPARPSLRLNMNPSTTATSISFFWSVADSVVTCSVVSWQRDTSGECPDVDRGSTPVAGSSTSTTINGQEEDSRYFITVTVFNDAGSSEVSNTVLLVTEEAAPSAAPTSVSATTSTSTTITVQWGPVECIERNGVITGYSVQYWIQDQSTQIMSAPGDSSGGSYEITGLQSSTTYSIQVAALTGASREGPYSSAITEVTTGGVTLSVDSISTTSLTISWTLAEGVTATSYTISYENTDCFTMTYDDITTSEMTLVLTGLEEGTEYSITVTATLTGGGEIVRDTETATTTPTAPSAPPDSVRLSIVSSTAITVQWEMVPCIHRNGDITGYSVQYTEGGSIQTVSVTGGDATMTTIEGLRPATTYSIVMAAVNDAGTGEYSDPMIIQTPESGVFLKLRSDIIPNHGYVVIGDIGFSGTDDDSLLCITDGVANADDALGNWFAPDRDRVRFIRVPGVTRNRGDMVVRLFRNAATGLPAEGIYHCTVQDATPVFQTVYVGLYNSGGGVVDVQSVTFILEDVASPQFTLTCISTGGPATTVTWTRDSHTAVGERRSDVVNGTTAQYANTLTVTGRLGGLYTCTVTNEVTPDGASASIIIQVTSAPTNVMAEQEGLTNIRVSWIPPSSGVNGYIIFYANSAGTNGSVTVDGGPTASLTLTGLQNGATYTISIIATSQHLPSEVTERVIMLVSPPRMPTIDTETAEVESTTISLSWTVPSDSVVTYSLVMWEIASSGGSSARAVRDERSGSSGRITGTSYTIEDLRSSTTYLITVTLINPAGDSSLQVTLSTTEGTDSSTSTISLLEAIIGEVVMAVIAMVVIVIVIVVLVMRKHRVPTGVQKRDDIPIATNEAYHTVSHAKAAEADYEQIGLDVIPTSRETTTDYETPHTVPPSTSHSSQPPTAGEYEQV